MKVAFHFNAEHNSFDEGYVLPILEHFFSMLIQHRTLSISTKVFIGDLLSHNLAMEREVVENGNKKTFNNEKYLTILQYWKSPKNVIWSRFEPDIIKIVQDNRIFVICLENIDLQLAEFLHQKLQNFPPYLGALEVDDTSPIHWNLYTLFLHPECRIIDSNLNLFWDGLIEDTKDESMLQFYKKLGFKTVAFESLEGKYTLFDQQHSFEHARIVAEWKKQCGSLLSNIADNVICSLSDIAPDLGNKLWAALKTFKDAETNEQLAQVTTSCRRIIEYVTDCIFPPTNGEHEGHKLGTKEYRNRLLAYADKERQSNTNIDLIVVSTEMLKEQLDKLSDLLNKGVHTEIYRHEARRCLLRTILLLDDIISLKADVFKIKIKIDSEFMLRILTNRDTDKTSPNI